METLNLDERSGMETEGDLAGSGIEAGELPTSDDEVWSRFFATRSQQDREELILRNAEMVRSCARAVRRRVPPSIDYADLISYGLLGLIDAVNRFDPGYGRAFSAYARKRITGSIIDGVRKEAGIPRTVYAKWKKVAWAEEELTGRLRREPERQEIAAFLGIEDDQCAKMLDEIHSWRLIYLDEAAFNEDQGGSETLMDMVVDEKAPDPGDVVEKGFRDASIRQAVNGLPLRYRIVLELYYFQEFSLKEIAGVMSVSESRASQMHCQALSSLRNKMSGSPVLLSA